MLFNETRQYNIYTFSIKRSLSSKRENKSNLQKHISNILTSTVTTALER